MEHSDNGSELDQVRKQQTKGQIDSEVYFLLREEFILPSDLHKIHEDPVLETIEDLTK